jgi:glycosyltransferase involved in cell wall biosynthesis
VTSAPLISVVICCYNRARMLPQTLDSVLAQTYRPIEVVVLDDGSTDDTPQVMQRYADRVRYHRQANQGVAHARTNAGRLATGPLIAFQDDDDLMAPGRLDVLGDALAAHPECAFAVGDLEVIGEDATLEAILAPRRDPIEPPAHTLFANGYEAVLWPRVPATNHTTLFRKADAERIGWFDPRYTIGGEDKDFFARLGTLGPVIHVARTVSFYRRGHASLTNKQLVTFYAALRLFQHHLADLATVDAPIRERLRQRILITLKAMARLEHDGVQRPAQVPAGYVADALPFLKPNEKLNYYWKGYVTARLRALLR